jgi:hypothetical protein
LTDSPTGSPTAKCLEFHTADFANSGDTGGWTLGSNAGWSSKYAGSIHLKDDAASSYIEKEFTQNDIGRMQDHGEVTLTFDFCTVSFEDNDQFAIQFSVDNGPFYTFAEYEKGPDFNNGCVSGQSQRFFLPGGSTLLKVRFVGGKMSHYDHLYIHNIAMNWCQGEFVKAFV